MEGMKHFNVVTIAANIKTNKSLETFMEVIGEGKLNHFTLTKVVLIVCHIVQTDP